jgi:hypothetical protein
VEAAIHTVKVVEVYALWKWYKHTRRGHGAMYAWCMIRIVKVELLHKRTFSVAIPK